MAAVAISAPASAVEIARDGTSLTVTITEPTPLEDVLQQFAAEFSLEVKGGIAGTMVAPAKFTAMTLPQILDRIVPGHAFVLVSNPQGEPIRIVVMGAGETSSAAAPAPQPAPAVSQMPQGTVGGGIEQRLRDIAMLSNRQDPEAARQLEELALRAQRIEARVAAIHGLGNFKDQRVLAFLRTRLLADPNPDIRVAAGEALQIADYDAARPAIEQAMAAERDEAQRERLRILLDQ